MKWLCSHSSLTVTFKTIIYSCIRWPLGFFFFLQNLPLDVFSLHWCNHSRAHVYCPETTLRSCGVLLPPADVFRYCQLQTLVSVLLQHLVAKQSRRCCLHSKPPFRKNTPMSDDQEPTAAHVDVSLGEAAAKEGFNLVAQDGVTVAFGSTPKVRFSLSGMDLEPNPALVQLNPNFPN